MKLKRLDPADGELATLRWFVKMLVAALIEQHDQVLCEEGINLKDGDHFRKDVRIMAGDDCDVCSLSSQANAAIADRPIIETAPNGVVERDPQKFFNRWWSNESGGIKDQSQRAFYLGIAFLAGIVKENSRLTSREVVFDEDAKHQEIRRAYEALGHQIHRYKVTLESTTFDISIECMRCPIVFYLQRMSSTEDVMFNLRELDRCKGE